METETPQPAPPSPPGVPPIWAQEPLPRPPVAEPIKQRIRDSFAIVPPGKNNAILGIADAAGGGRARLLIALRVGDSDVWKVGGQIGFGRHQKPDGWIGIEAAW